MADFRIWGRVEHIGVREFIAIVSGVPDVRGDVAIVLTETAPSLAEANQHKRRLMLEIGEKVRARGDRVVDVEED